MSISASQVKDLRERTGVGMMECKQALVEAGGDMEKAITWLRERGMSRAAKKAGRATAEGTVSVGISDDNTKGVLIEVNCETDFVAKNDDFQAFVAEITQLSLQKGAHNADAMNNLKLENGLSARDTLTGLVAKIGENLQLRRGGSLSAPGGVVVGYSHMGGKIATLVAIEGVKGEQGLALGRDLAMHVAASSPKYLDSSAVEKGDLEAEKEIAKKRLLEEGKPENMIDKIVMGQMTKFYKEVCFLEQPFVKDPKVSVTQYVKATAPNAKVTGFLRFQLGEGVEKKEDDFAEEVAKLTKS